MMIKRKRYYTNPGSRIVQQYRAVIDKNTGKIDLTETTTYDLYEYIQSFKESTDINSIIARCQAGDLSVLNKRQPMYFDATEFPKTYAEMYQKIIDATAYFESLPLDVRDKFGHSPETFFATIGQDMWLDAMKTVLPQTENVTTPVTESEVPHES